MEAYAPIMSPLSIFVVLIELADLRRLGVPAIY
jgi:hypothetical protein